MLPLPQTNEILTLWIFKWDRFNKILIVRYFPNNMQLLTSSVLRNIANFILNKTHGNSRELNANKNSTKTSVIPMDNVKRFNQLGYG